MSSPSAPATPGDPLFMPECYEPPPAVPASERADSRNWQLPVALVGNSTVISFFGDPRDRGARSHAGIDIGAPRGTPVRAPVDAKVITSRQGGRGGHTIVLLDTAAEIQFVFTHLDSRAVQTGQYVLAGQPVSRSAR